jgi:hypothetical protein
MSTQKNKIKIKPENKGKFKAWAKRKGLLNKDGSVGMKAIRAGLKSDRASVRRMATFANNARKWKKGKKRK